MVVGEGEWSCKNKQNKHEGMRGQKITNTESKCFLDYQLYLDYST